MAQALTIADILEIQDSRETRNEVLIQDLLSGPVVGTHNVSSSLNHNVPMSCVSRGDEDRGISAKEDSGEAGDIRGTKPLKIIKSPAYSKGTYASVAEVCSHVLAAYQFYLISIIRIEMRFQNLNLFFQIQEKVLMR